MTVGISEFKPTDKETEGKHLRLDTIRDHEVKNTHHRVKRIRLLPFYGGKGSIG